MPKYVWRECEGVEVTRGHLPPVFESGAGRFTLSHRIPFRAVS